MFGAEVIAVLLLFVSVGLAVLYRKKEQECIKLNTDNQLLQNQVEGTSDIKNQMKEAFRNLSNEVLEHSSKKLNEVNKENLSGVVKPLKEQLEDFRKATERMSKSGTESHTQLLTKIEDLHKVYERSSQETVNLTNALKGSSVVRGNWGEQTLELILEASGVRYTTQKSFKSESGDQLRPDCMVPLPQQRAIIIDSKLNLKYWALYTQAEEDIQGAGQDSEQQSKDSDEFLKQHANALQTHIKELGKKKYHELLDGHQLDYTLMFVPIEAALLGALKFKPSLRDEAFAKNIIIVSQGTLMLALGIVAQMWNTQKQQDNIEKIVKQGKAVYDKAQLFTESMEQIGKSIKQASNAWEEGTKRLHTGQGNLVDQADKLSKLGISSQKSSKTLSVSDSANIDN